jgi:hypothetical protein
VILSAVIRATAAAIAVVIAAGLALPNTDWVPIATLELS